MQKYLPYVLYSRSTHRNINYGIFFSHFTQYIPLLCGDISRTVGPTSFVRYSHYISQGSFVLGRRAGWQLSGAETPDTQTKRAMAATGGGKIRSRRYHIASKPYAKSKQVNRAKVFFMTKARVEDVAVIVVPQFPSCCYCFLETFYGLLLALVASTRC